MYSMNVLKCEMFYYISLHFIESHFMVRFLYGNALNLELENIINEANKELLLVSPFIRFHHRFKQCLLAKQKKDRLNIKVVFGKNEENPSKSISKEEVSFLSQLPNIEIRYESRLHAKFYANEKRVLITSMNLYDYSQDNNVEAGILVSANFFDHVLKLLKVRENNVENEARRYFDKVFSTSESILKKIPEYEKSMMGILNKCVGTKVVKDRVDDFFRQQNKGFEEANSVFKIRKTGYCIRTGIEIPFNIEKPMSYPAYQTWAEYQNPDYPENFCHLTGQPSYGKNSMRRPIIETHSNVSGWSKIKVNHTNF